MNKRTFLTYDKPLLTCMVQAENPNRIKALIDASVTEGAEAIGMQFCQLKSEYRNKAIYKELFLIPICLSTLLTIETVPRT